MRKEGIFPGDLLIVDRALTAKSGSIVIAIVDGELLVRSLIYQNQRVFLCPGNSGLESVEITKEQDFSIWSVVTTIIHLVV